MISYYLVMKNMKYGFYDRVLKVEGISNEDLDSLAKVRVAVIGLGGLGANVALNLVRNGFRNFKLVDPDILLYTDIYRGNIFSVGDTGYFKVEVVKKALSEVSPDVNVTIYPMMLTDFNIERILRGVDIIVDATDNIYSKALINRYSVKENIPVLYSAVKNNSGRILFLEPSETACFECIHPNVEEIEDGYIDGYGFQYIYSLVSSIVSSEVTSYFLGYESSIYGSILKIDTGFKLDLKRIQYNPSCPICRSNEGVEYPDIDYQHFMKGETFIYTSDERVRLDIERLSRELVKNYILLRRGDVGIYFEYNSEIGVGVAYTGTVVLNGVKGFEEAVNITRKLVEDIFYRFVID